MFTKDDYLKAVYSSDIDAFLARLEVLEQFDQGKFACKYCKEVITRHNLYAIIPMPKKKLICVVTDQTVCYLSLRRRNK